MTQNLSYFHLHCFISLFADMKACNITEEYPRPSITHHFKKKTNILTSSYLAVVSVALKNILNKQNRIFAHKNSFQKSLEEENMQKNLCDASLGGGSVTLNFLRKLWKYPPKTCFTNILKISCFLQFLLIDVHIFKHPTGAPRSHFLSKANKFLLSFNICVVSFCLCLHFLPNISSILWNSWAFVRRLQQVTTSHNIGKKWDIFSHSNIKKEMVDSMNFSSVST